jgi:hypothetical protein
LSLTQASLAVKRQFLTAIQVAKCDKLEERRKGSIKLIGKKAVDDGRVQSMKAER